MSLVTPSFLSWDRLPRPLCFPPITPTTTANPRTTVSQIFLFLWVPLIERHSTDRTSWGRQRSLYVFGPFRLNAVALQLERNLNPNGTVQVAVSPEPVVRKPTRCTSSRSTSSAASLCPLGCRERAVPSVLLPSFSRVTSLHPLLFVSLCLAFAVSFRISYSVLPSLGFFRVCNAVGL